MKHYCVVCNKVIEGEPFWQVYWEEKRKKFFFCSEECRAKWLTKKSFHIQIRGHIKGDPREAINDRMVLRNGELKLIAAKLSGDKK